MNGPRVGVPEFEGSGLPDAVREAGGEPVPLHLPEGRPVGGVALVREWMADLLEIQGAVADLDGLLLCADRQEEIFGMLVAALRLDLPTVCVPPESAHLFATLVALGLAPIVEGPADAVSRIARLGGPRCREVVGNFSLANALRAGLAAGGGPGLPVHLAALASEASVVGFGQMVRVLTPETPEVEPEWLREHGAQELLATLGDALHDVPTVAGSLKASLPPERSTPDEHARLVLVSARASGAEAVCRARSGVAEVAGECRVFGSEEEAVLGVRRGEVGEGDLLVVGGCGPRGGPGLLRLDALGRSLRQRGLEVPVLTDGLAPEDAAQTWISLFAPEAAEGSVLGLLRDGDTLRIDLTKNRIRARAQALDSREPREFPDRGGTAYTVRYAGTALPALDGAGFG